MKNFFRSDIYPDRGRKRDGDQPTGPLGGWSLLFGPGRAGMYIERGLFCLALCALAHFAPWDFFHVGYAPIVQWVMFIAAVVYISIGWIGALALGWD